MISDVKINEAALIFRSGMWAVIEKIKAKVRVLSLLLLVVPSTNYAAVADEARMQRLSSLSLAELLDIKVKSSTLSEKPLLYAPSSVTVFNASQISNLGANYLQDLIHFVPGFQVFRQGESSAEYFHSSRGHRSSTTSREVLILVDGMRLIRELDNSLAIPMLSLHNVEKIEFIRGPGSALYGSNAMFGVIDIKTSRNNKLDLLVGENNQHRIAAQFNTRMNSWNVGLDFHAFEERGEEFILENFYTSERDTGRDPVNGYDAALFLSSDNTEISIADSKRMAEDFYITERRLQNFNKMEVNRSHVSIEHHFQIVENIESELHLVLSENNYKPQTAFAGPTPFQASVSEENYEILWRNNYRFKNDELFSFGTVYRESKISGFSYDLEGLGNIEIYPRTERNVTGLYLQYEGSLDDDIQYTLGARYDHYADIASSTSPRFAIIKLLPGNQSIKFLYGQAFRAPTTNELYLQNTGGGLVGNPDLKPEKTQSTELAWIKQAQKYALSATVFYNAVTDIISRVELPDSSTFFNQSEEESFYGLELEYSLELTKRVLWNFNVSQFSNLPDSDFRQAESLFSTVLNYNQEAWNINISAHYAGKRQYQVGADYNNLDGYWLLNTKWQYRLTGGTQLYLQASNLMDEEYFTPSQRAVLSEGIPNRGRELALGLRFNF